MHVIFSSTQLPNQITAEITRSEAFARITSLQLAGWIIENVVADTAGYTWTFLIDPENDRRWWNIGVSKE